MTENGKSRLAAEAQTFLRFCVVGGIGFVTDAGILAALIRGVNAGPMIARAISLPAAIMVTFMINRHWSFRDRARRPWLAALGRYCAVQSFGLICNLLVYAGAVLLIPPPFNDPVLCLTIASAVALAVNYSGLRRFVFSSPR